MAGRITYTGNIVTNGLVLNLDAGKLDSYPRSGTVWRDISGNNFTGSLFNGSTFNSENAGSIVFDGVNDIASFGTQLNFNFTNFTVCVWAKSPTNVSGEVGYPLHVHNLVGKGNWNATNSWRIGYRSIGNDPATTITFSYGVVWFNGVGIDVTSYDVSKFNYFVGVATPTQQSIYVNDNLSASIALTKVSDISNELDFQLGRASYTDRYFRGNIGQVQIYNRALTATEVSQNFNALRGRYGI